MRTSRPIATIAYPDKFFLICELDKLITDGTISFYSFVVHQPEEDEKKVHTHLFIIPNGQINTDTLKPILSQHDPLNPTKPKGVMPFGNSKFGDWLLYSLHDVDYLASKGQTRKYHYSLDEFVTSDRDYFVELYHTIDLSKITKVRYLREAAERGDPFEKLVVNGIIPPQQYVGYEKMYQAIWVWVHSQKSNIVRRSDKSRWSQHD